MPTPHIYRKWFIRIGCGPGAQRGHWHSGSFRFLPTYAGAVKAFAVYKDFFTLLKNADRDIQPNTPSYGKSLTDAGRAENEWRENHMLAFSRRESNDT